MKGPEMINFTMNNGLEIPALGYGTFMMSSDEVSKALPQAIDVGFRHIDTANAYFNEVAVGEAIARSGIDREEFFVTTKLFPQDYPETRCMDAIDASLRRLGMEYVDLLLLHQPYGAYTEAWSVLEQAQKQGKVRSIGLSNFNRKKFQQVLDVADVVPQVLQVEINPRNHQHEMKQWLDDRNIVFEGWYPLGHGDRKLIESPLFTKLAEKYGKSNSQIILRWHLQERNVVFPKTSNPDHMRENLDIFDFELTDDEMAQINAMPQMPYYVVSEETPAFVLAESDFDQQR
jgi:2,5-diketo-D-gluconate reductase A